MSTKDELYNVFLNNNHTTKQEKMLISYNLNVINSILKRLKSNKKKIDLLELGVGKGYFAQACREYNETGEIEIKYSAFDRNKEMLRQLTESDKTIRTYSGELPKLTIKNKKFDIIYCAFVVEHLKNGLEVYDLINNMKKLLNDGGLMVLFTPNALSQRFEFYNIDYTHQYPTTARNVTMAFKDCNIEEVKVTKINGLCTYKGFENQILRVTHKVLFSLYSYRLFSAVLQPFYRTPLYDLNNFFYRVFCFFKEENLMFVARYNK